MAGRIDVSIILVNYRSQEHTLRCVQSIVEQTRDVSYEIIVVDNHTAFDATRLPRERTLFLAADRNLGFGVACTWAAQHAHGRYLFFLNNDSLLLNDAASRLTQCLDRRPEGALAGAQLEDPSGKHIASFDYFPTLASKLLGIGVLRFFNPERFPEKKQIYTHPLSVDLVAGACLFIRNEVFQELGGFDPRFFLYCEEEDLAMRVRQRGLATFFVPDARVRHVGGGSSTAGLALKKEFYISFLKFYRKQYGRIKAKMLFAVLFLQFLWKFWRRPDEREWWRPLLSWMCRHAPESDSLRFLPGHLDDPLLPPFTLK